MPTLPDALGYLHYEEVSAPGAGAVKNIDPPQGYRWRLLSVAFRLVTDANVASRRVYLAASAPFALQTPSLVHVSSIAQNANVTFDYTFSIGALSSSNLITPNVAVPLQIVPLADQLYITYGTVFTIAIDAIEAGDQLSRITLYVEEWPTP